MPLVGTHIIKSLKDFHVDPVLSAEQREAVQGRREGKTSSIRSLLSSTHNRWEEKRGRGRRKRRGGRRRGKKKGRGKGGGGGREGTTFSGFYLHSLASVGSHWMTCK